MIKILIVEDSEPKRTRIRTSILDNSNISATDIMEAACIKDARKLLYSNSFDLMVLDLLLPIEVGQEAEAKNGVGFLNEVSINPSIRPPIHIVGVSGYLEEIEEHQEDFNLKLWSLIEYDESTSSWEDRLKSLIFHLVKIRIQFLSSSVDDQLKVIFKNHEESNMPNTYIGHTWSSITDNLASIVEKSLQVPSKFSNGAKAKNINKDSVIIQSEYDFQNLAHLVLRPWLPSVEPENVAVIFDGNSKNADFSIKGNSLIVEAKYIDSTGKKNDVLKTLSGLDKFYSANANVQSLLFLILVEEGIDLDKHKVEAEFSKPLNEPCVIVKVIINSLAKP